MGEDAAAGPGPGPGKTVVTFCRPVVWTRTPARSFPPGVDGSGHSPGEPVRWVFRVLAAFKGIWSCEGDNPMSQLNMNLSNRTSW